MARLTIGGDAELMAISARTEEALDIALARLRDGVERSSSTVADAARDARHGSIDRPCRAAFVRAPGDAIDEVLARRARHRSARIEACRPPRLIIVFPGAGTQYPGMARDLYESEPIFRESVDGSCAASLEFGACDPRRLILADRGDTAVGDEFQAPSRSGVAILAYQLAMFHLLRSKGISPDAVVGHSLGEYACAVVSGALGLRDAFRIMHVRSALLEELDVPSAMLVLSESVAYLADLLDGETVVTAHNAPRSNIVSGPAPAIEQLRRLCEGRGVACHQIRYGTASHCHLIEPILDRFEDSLADLPVRRPALAWWSTVTAKRQSPDVAVGAHYWRRQFRSPVLFAEAVLDAAGDAPVAFLEIGPQNGLVNHISAVVPGAQTLCCSPNWRDRRGGCTAVLDCLGSLWCRGLPLAWDV